MSSSCQFVSNVFTTLHNAIKPKKKKKKILPSIQIQIGLHKILDYNKLILFLEFLFILQINKFT